MDRLIAFDVSLSQRFSLPLESGWWQLARLTAHLGDGPYVFGGLGLLYLLGWVRSDTYLRWRTLLIALIVFLTLTIIALIKFVVRRERPLSPGEFVTFRYDAYSFPSGHSARLAALALSTILLSPGFGWPLIILALSVSLARIAVGVHYVIDIVAGLIVGTTVAWAAMTVVLPLFPGLVP